MAGRTGRSGDAAVRSGTDAGEAGREVPGGPPGTVPLRRRVGTASTTRSARPAAPAARGSVPSAVGVSARNEVLLVGRVPAAPQERELPSGDCLVTWRLVVERGPGRPPPEGVRAPTVDTLDCVAWTASARRTATALLPDDVVEVRGALRRRFWRAGAGSASRCEVEATSVRRLDRRSRA